MQKISYACAIACLLVNIVTAGYIDHNFDSSAEDSGFLIKTNGWQSTDATVVVTAITNASDPHSVIIPAGTSISNNIAEASPTKAWTELRVIPVLGDEPDSPDAADGSTCALYFKKSGKVVIWVTNEWITCDNNVWGTSLAELDGTNWAEVSFYQNFDDETAVVFINGVVALQDIPFSASVNNYNYFAADNVSSNAFLDDVRVQANYSTRLTNDINGINGIDAAEVDAHGYVGRILYVGTGGPTDVTFASLQAAVDEARNLDRIHIFSATIAEDIVFEDGGDENDTYYIIGEAFTNNGTFTVDTGAILHIEQFADISTNIVTGTLSLSNNLVTADLTVTGTVNGNSISATDVDVGGAAAVTIASGGIFDIGTLVMVNGGAIGVTSGGLTEENESVNLTGTFTLDASDWNNSSVIVASLDFTEKFEDFKDGLALASRGANFKGWGASSSDVRVQGAKKYKGLLAAIIPAGGTLSNRVDGAGHDKVWTEYYVMPVLGDAPDDPNTNSAIFMSYINTNGYMVIPDGTGWITNSEDMSSAGYQGMSTTTWTRVDIFTDFTGPTNKYALFIEGRIAVEQQDFVGAQASASYNSFSIFNKTESAYIDDVLITVDIPPDMTNDVNNNGTADAIDIHNFGTINPPAKRGTLFMFR